ncbi:MAG TPA: serine/threonine-protein kinase, partial [Pirellulaceae bacterium]
MKTNPIDHHREGSPIDDGQEPGPAGTPRGESHLFGADRDDGTDPILRYCFLWQQATRPDLTTFVSQAGPLSIDQLGCLVRIDLRHGWAHETPIPIEWYLEHFPQLESDRGAAVDVIYAEYLQRERRGLAPSANEFSRRFPRFALELNQQIEFHDLLQGPSVSPEHQADAKPRDRRNSQDETLGLAVAHVDTRDVPVDPLTEATIGYGASVHPTTRQPRVAGYRIVEQLGRGGFGVVYKAVDERLNRTVALKMLLAGTHASDRQIRRFQAEAEAVARLLHPHIAQIHEVGECDGNVYLSMEFVDGESLADFCEGRPQSARWSATLLEQIARAVEFAHRQGIVHRDLKPANVLLVAS